MLLPFPQLKKFKLLRESFRLARAAVKD